MIHSQSTNINSTYRSKRVVSRWYHHALLDGSLIPMRLCACLYYHQIRRRTGLDANSSIRQQISYKTQHPRFFLGSRTVFVVYTGSVMTSTTAAVVVVTRLHHSQVPNENSSGNKSAIVKTTRLTKFQCVAVVYGPTISEVKVTRRSHRYVSWHVPPPSISSCKSSSQNDMSRRVSLYSQQPSSKRLSQDVDR